MHTIANTHGIAPGTYTGVTSGADLSVRLPDGSWSDMYAVFDYGTRGVRAVTVTVTAETITVSAGLPSIDGAPEIERPAVQRRVAGLPVSTCTYQPVTGQWLLVATCALPPMEAVTGTLDGAPPPSRETVDCLAEVIAVSYLEQMGGCGYVEVVGQVGALIGCIHYRYGKPLPPSVTYVSSWSADGGKS